MNRFLDYGRSRMFNGDDRGNRVAASVRAQQNAGRGYAASRRDRPTKSARHSATVSVTTTARGRQKLLAIWGQVHSYAFQVELLKRCDPEVAARYLVGLKANALTVRYLIGELGSSFVDQKCRKWTALTCSVWLALRKAMEEGEHLINVLSAYTLNPEMSTKEYFAESMKLSRACEFHAECELETYGGSVRANVLFLHDIENVLKQLNYCHLIVSSGAAFVFLQKLEDFLLKTVGCGGVVPQEIYDPSHPCSVCFEELCVTANRGESARKRVAGKICDHITKQIRVRLAKDEISGYLPHASHVNSEQRDCAVAALARLSEDLAAAKRRRDCSATSLNVYGDARGEEHDENDDFESLKEAAEHALNEHNVFIPASGRLHAVSELKFWLASSGERVCSSRGRTVDAFSDNLDNLDARERDFEMRCAVVENSIFGKRMNHFERTYADALDSMQVVDRLLLGGRSCSPDDTIEALIKACYDHHLSAPLLKRLADPEKAAEDALRKALEGVAMNKNNKKKRKPSDNFSKQFGKKGKSQFTLDNSVGRFTDCEKQDEEDEEDDDYYESLRPQYRAGRPPSRKWCSGRDLRPIDFGNVSCASTKTSSCETYEFMQGFEDRPGEIDSCEDEEENMEDRVSLITEERRRRTGNDEDGWLAMTGAAAADAFKRRKMYADRLTKRSLAALDRCVTEQRKELEKELRVNVFGEILVDSFVTVFNGFSSRAEAIALASGKADTYGAKVVDNRSSEHAFDAHRFMRSALLRRRVDPAMLPSLTHKFFQLVNGPLFNHDRHTFAQPPNTALYLSVENVDLLPHLKEELARFMVNGGRSGSAAYGTGSAIGGGGGSDWTVSRFRGFYDFGETEGVTATQRLAWEYIKELILAAALFSSVFRCGEIRVLRADSVSTDFEGEKIWRDGIYITYEKSCPLIAILGTDQRGRITQDTTIIIDSDVFSLLYTVLQKMAPGAVEKARMEEAERNGQTCVASGGGTKATASRVGVQTNV